MFTKNSALRAAAKTEKVLCIVPDSFEIDFAGESLLLLADRAIYWPREEALVIADVHLGKDASFRAAGLSVPAGNSAKDLARIEKLLAATGARRLLILGDLVHTRASHQPELAEAFRRWRSLHGQLEIRLIRGNHDRHAGPTPADWNIEQLPDPFEHGPLLLGHFPQPTSKPLLCGHVHPSFGLRDFDRSVTRVPCFVVGLMQLILPAFGSFTGGYKVEPAVDRKIFIASGKSVVRAV